MLMRKGSCSPPGPRSPTGCSSSANGICGQSWPSTWPTTTDAAPIAAASCTRPGLTIPPPTSPRSGSGDGPSSVASSTNTSGPRRSPGQDQRPSSGTPHAAKVIEPLQHNDPVVVAGLWQERPRFAAVEGLAPLPDVLHAHNGASRPLGFLFRRLAGYELRGSLGRLAHSRNHGSTAGLAQ